MIVTRTQRNNVIIMLAMLMVLSAVIAFGPFHHVNAASDEPPPLCEPIAMGGGIMVYRCEPAEGPSFLLNSLGFMLVEN